MRKILRYSEKNRKRINKLPKIYLIACWARWGVMEFPFYKFTKDNIPLVYHYNDYNGTADLWELIPIQDATTGWIWDWTFNGMAAKKVAELLNKRDNLELDKNV